MNGPPITPDESVARVLRAYDGCMLQGYDHDFTLMFVARKLGVPITTVTKALAVREAHATKEEI